MNGWGGGAPPGDTGRATPRAPVVRVRGTGGLFWGARCGGVRVGRRWRRQWRRWRRQWHRRRRHHSRFSGGRRGRYRQEQQVQCVTSQRARRERRRGHSPSRRAPPRADLMRPLPPIAATPPAVAPPPPRTQTAFPAGGTPVGGPGAPSPPPVPPTGAWRWCSAAAPRAGADRRCRRLGGVAGGTPVHRGVGAGPVSGGGLGDGTARGAGGGG